MPELPEVQTTVDGINSYAKGLRIADVWTDYFSPLYASKDHIKNKTFFKEFARRTVGAKILRAERRAKNVLIHLSNNETILVHMKMTGHLLYGSYVKTSVKNDPWKPKKSGSALSNPFNRFVHLVFTLSNGKHLALSDVRKFAKVTVVKTETLLTSEHLSGIGPEPLDPTFTAAILHERLQKKPNGVIKTVLMDQTVVAGIGNIYSDEILWASNIHPLSKVLALSKKDITLIWKNTKLILRKGINFGGDSTSDYRNLDGEPGKFHYAHKAYRQTGKRCTKKGCKGIIHRIALGGRGAHFCPTHQILKK